MTGDTVPSDPSVLNTTVLSNFAYVNAVGLVANLDGICTVPAVRTELQGGVDNHPYLQSALDELGESVPVVSLSGTVTDREEKVRTQLDRGEAQAFAVTDVHGGRLLTDDGDARSFATEKEVTVVGSVGVLLAAIDDEQIDEETANDWLSTWIDEIDYYVPYRDISEYE